MDNHDGEYSGLNGTAPPETDSIGWSGLAIPDAARPFVYTLSQARDELRRKARSAHGLSPDDIQATSDIQVAKLGAEQEEEEIYANVLRTFTRDLKNLTTSANVSKDVLQLCDRVRDIDLWDRGIYLEDRDGNQPALIRPVTKELRLARQEKDNRDEEKLRARGMREKEAVAKADKGRLSHLDMFRTNEFSAWDEQGMPLKDEKGDDLTKSRAKKLRKDWDRQKKLHEEWQKRTS